MNKIRQNNKIAPLPMKGAADRSSNCRLSFFYRSRIDVTFLSPNKKVTKEVVTGEALMPRRKRDKCTLPCVPLQRASKNCVRFLRHNGTSPPCRF